MKAARGFTLVEMMVTVAIIGVLVSMAVPVREMLVQRAKEQELRLALRDIRGAIDAYKRAADEGKVKVDVGDSGYPKSLDALASGVDNISSPDRKKIYFLRSLPRDPMQSDLSLAPSSSWGKRSYASSHEEPRDEGDVFDVYSLSNARGTNGIAYREW
jgi:general secretion pathway protein G